MVVQIKAEEVPKTLTCERLGCRCAYLVGIRDRSNRTILVCASCRKADELWAELDKAGKTEIRNPNLQYTAIANESRMMEE